MDRIFIYGFTTDNSVKLLKESNLNITPQGMVLEKIVNTNSIKNFIEEYLSGKNIDYDDLHNFCVDFLICDTKSSNEVKNIL